jgi:hypothetical protein
MRSCAESRVRAQQPTGGHLAQGYGKARGQPRQQQKAAGAEAKEVA